MWKDLLLRELMLRTVVLVTELSLMDCVESF